MWKFLNSIDGISGNLDDKKIRILELAYDIFRTFGPDEAEPPSSAICLMMTACGQKLPQVLASSINSFGETHFCFSEVYKYIRNKDHCNMWPGNIPGLGHPKFKNEDPRVKYLIEYCEKVEYKNTNLNFMAKQSKDKNLCLNFAGFLTCILIDCGFDEHNIDLVPMIWRMVGLTNMHQKAKLAGVKFQSSYGILEEYKTIS